LVARTRYATKLGVNMRTNVTFRHPAEFMPLSNNDAILAVGGAQWFVALLGRVPGLQIEEDLCQEDWGVVLFVQRDHKKFWIGLSAWDSENGWLSHFHHGSFAWWQRLCSSGRRAMQSLLTDVHSVLVSEPGVFDIVWYEESEVRKPRPVGFPTPL
jgi:hypothetical protein